MTRLPATLGFVFALLAALVLVPFTASYLATREQPEADRAAAAAEPEAPLAGAYRAAPDPDGARKDEGGRGGPPELEAEPLFDARERLEPGKAARLRFRARHGGSASPASGADLSVSLFHGRDPELRLAASEVGDGVYEVAFTPAGPGQYRLVVNAGGAPIGSPAPVKLGVVGAVGGGDEVVDDSQLVDVDPFHSRSKGVGRRMRH
jgi:hypothetical protein